MKLIDLIKSTIVFPSLGRLDVNLLASSFKFLTAVLKI